MELKAGYKKTEVGVIPEEWEIEKLDKISSIVMGQSPVSINYNKKGIGLPLVQGNTDIKNRKTIIRNYTSQITKKSKLGDIIMSVRAPVGEIATATFDSCIGRGVCAIKYPNNFLYHYLVFVEPNWSKHSTGSTFDSVNSDTIKSLKIPLPPLPEQKAIATVLSDTDKLIQALEKKIAKKQLIKKGAMQKLLSPTDPTTGKIKDGWEVKTLGEIAKYRRGSFPQPYGLPEWYDENNGMPFVQVYDVDKNMRLKPTTKQKISELAKDKSVFVKRGSIILTIQGSIGRIAVTQYDAYVDRTLLIFTDYKISINVVFFSFIVQEKFRIEKENAPGGIIKTITKEALSKFKMVFPKSPQEQTRIAKILSDMDSEIETLEKKLKKYKQIKQGLMQVLLTGKIRLV